MQISASLSVNEANNIPITNELQITIGVEFRFISVGVDEPIVVSIFMVIASDLLLVRTLRVCLDVGMQKTTAIAHVLQSDARSMCNFKWAILADFSAAQVGLEQRTHLSITGAAVGEYEEVKVEGEHVDQNRDDDQSSYTSNKMLCEHGLEM